MKYFLLIATVCILAFSSCKTKTDYSKEISRLDSAIIKLKDAEKVFYSADTGSLRTTYHFFQGKLRLITERIAKDTVNKNTALFLSIAYEQTGNLQNLLENNKFLERALGEGQQRINDLKHDLAEDLIDKNKSQEYIVNELNASQKISETVHKTVGNAKMAQSKLDSLKTQIIFWADSLSK